MYWFDDMHGIVLGEQKNKYRHRYEKGEKTKENYSVPVDELPPREKVDAELRRVGGELRCRSDSAESVRAAERTVDTAWAVYC